MYYVHALAFINVCTYETTALICCGLNIGVTVHYREKQYDWLFWSPIYYLYESIMYICISLWLSVSLLIIYNISYDIIKHDMLSIYYFNYSILFIVLIIT